MHSFDDPRPVDPDTDIEPDALDERRSPSVEDAAVTVGGA
jgi:hypothetical protein